MTSIARKYEKDWNAVMSSKTFFYYIEIIGRSTRYFHAHNDIFIEYYILRKKCITSEFH